MNWKLLLKPVLIFFAVFLFLSFILLVIPVNSLWIGDQPKGEALTIKRVSLANEGFVVVSAMGPQNLPDYLNIVTLSEPELLPAGIYRNLNIVMNEGSLTDKKAIVVGLYSDTNGNGIFDGDPNIDKPVMNFGREVRTRINVK